MSNDAVNRVVSFVGTSNSGKTTLLERVIGDLKQRGYRVGVVKHTYHEGKVDKPGKDTWRFSRAGCDVVALASPSQLALIERLDVEAGLAEIVARLEGKVDIVLTEGYKELDTPKVLVRGEAEEHVPSYRGQVLVTVTSRSAPSGARLFTDEDVDGVVDLLTERLVSRPTSEEMVEAV